MEVLFTLLAMAILLLLQGFFSGSEIALVNADKIHLRHLARKGNRGAGLVLKMFERPERLLATTLVGTNVCTVSLATLGTVAVIRLMGQGGDLVAFLVMTPIMLLFGEVVPKSVYQQKANELAPVIIYPLRLFSWLFFPVIWVFSWVARLAVRVWSRGQAPKSVFVAREKMRALLELAEQGPTAETFDHQRIRRAMRFSDITVSESMIPLSDAVMISSSTPMTRAIERVRRSGFSRLPVYDTQEGRVIGILVLTTWDLLDPDIAERPLEDYLHPALFVAPTERCEALLPRLQALSERMAIVVDEFGSAIGIITVEDILEEVVGGIADARFQLHDHHRHRVTEREDGGYEIDAVMSVADLNERLHVHLPAREFRTVGRLLLSRLQRIPRVGDSFEEDGVRLTVTEADERMARRVRIDRA